MDYITLFRFLIIILYIFCLFFFQSIIFVAINIAILQNISFLL